jgi:nicotinate-nucleotide adenylyltransferase
MEFLERSPYPPRRLGILPGTFNPPTRAHLALARAALAFTDEVLFVLPRTFPHKPYTGATFEERVQMLRTAYTGCAGFSIAASNGGLFLEIAGECRAAYGPDVTLSFLCGRDAAERIIEWDYGRPGVIADMLDAFDLLVAARHGGYQPPEPFRHRVRTLGLEEECDHVSATEVRERVAHGQAWEHLVPETIVHLVHEIYTRPPEIAI